MAMPKKQDPRRTRQKESLLLRSVEDTHSFAARVAEKIHPPAVILLEGELGVGKTEWVRGFVKAYLGDVGLVMSPTYTLINAYEHESKRVYHVDLYRLIGEDDLESIGFWDLLAERNVVIIVEWAEKITSPLPSSHKIIKIILEKGSAPSERKASIQPAFF